MVGSRVLIEDDLEDAEDEDDDSPKRRLNFSAALRPLAAIGLAALILGWTAMLWQISGSLAALNDSASSIAAELGTVQAVAATVTEAEDLPATESESSAMATATPVEPDLTSKVALTEPASVQAVTQTPGMLLGKPVVTNGNDVWDCDDFETWDQAKLVYEANLPQDPNILDFFVTGVPCGHLQATE